MNLFNQNYWYSVFSFRSVFFTIIGVFFAVLGLKGFLLPNKFIDGGVTGISVLLTGFSEIHISYSLFLINLPFILLGFRKLGSQFGMQAFLAITLLSTGMYFIEIPVITTDKVLIAMFGGLFIGFGIGCVLRGGGIIDGFDVIAQYTEKKSPFTSGEIILTLNTLMILGAAYRFGIESGMYSIMVYYTAMQTTNYVVDGFEKHTALSIVSNETRVIQQVILSKFQKGITIFKGRRGFLPDSFNTKTDCDIIMTVVTRLEIHRIQKTIRIIDPEAFIFVSNLKEMSYGESNHTQGLKSFLVLEPISETENNYAKDKTLKSDLRRYTPNY
ncbi:YitT family protein [Salegentibacter sp. JZCK2]|uniref:YitT family protein n=1 Tax=Salegentibacter tibetensis TaxID=2873600 RepID=UPI001CCF2E03|nr:YitT family protein [Salegentibacter tibetensis]MBZ9730637.1 YitT family protein [Salegentibacter tibetensis]